MHVMSLKSLAKRYIALRPIACAATIDWRICIKASLLYLSLPIIICLASFIDGTWWLQTPGKGLFQHYGMIAIFLTAPAIVILTTLVLQKFLLAMEGLHNYTHFGTVPPDLERLVNKHLRSLALRKKSAWMLLLFCVIGFLFSLANIMQTIDPVNTYGNPVYDSWPYPYGFYSTKIYLCLIWTFIYPAALFVALHITASMMAILGYMCRHELLRIDFFHPDNCGGVSIFGSINLLVMAIYGNLFSVLYMLHITHSAKTYITVTVPWFGLSLVFIVQSFVAVYSVHKFAAIKRRESLNDISMLLSKEIKVLFAEAKFSADLIHVRNHLLGLETYPYAKPVVVNTIRFVPAILGIAKILML